MVALRCLMPLPEPLTIDDLDEIGCSFGEQPFEVAAELVNAVDQGLLDDRADMGYALMLAAELTERAGDLLAAQLLAERAVAAYCVYDEPDGYAQAFHAELLLRLGREDEGLAQLTAIRPMLSDEPGAVSYISEALGKGGRPEIAEQWLTEALVAALQQRQELESQQDSQPYKDAAEVASRLAQERHRVRRNLGLPHDEHDVFAESLMSSVMDTLGTGWLDSAGTAVLFWPRREFDLLLVRWPELAKEYGQNWGEYLTTVEQSMVRWSESGYPRFVLFAADVDQLARYAERAGSDPTDPQIRQGYLGYLQEIAWPPL